MTGRAVSSSSILIPRSPCNMAVKTKWHLALLVGHANTYYYYSSTCCSWAGYGPSAGDQLHEWTQCNQGHHGHRMMDFNDSNQGLQVLAVITNNVVTTKYAVCCTLRLLYLKEQRPRGGVKTANKFLNHYKWWPYSHFLEEGPVPAGARYKSNKPRGMTIKIGFSLYK